MPHAAQLDVMLQQLCDARQDAAVCIVFGDWQLGRYQGRAFVFPSLPAPAEDFCVQWNGETELELPELGGTLHFEPTIGTGVSLEKLQQATVSVRPRRGAEKIRMDSKRPTRTLKNLLQEQGIPPWRRDTLPLLCCGDMLVAVPGVGVGCDYQAGQEEAGVNLEWRLRHG
jgi:tRNA(Ile)-lysidine synthase